MHSSAIDATAAKGDPITMPGTVMATAATMNTATSGSELATTPY